MLQIDGCASAIVLADCVNRGWISKAPRIFGIGVIVDGTSGDDPPYRRVSAVGMLVNAIGTISNWKSQTRYATITDGLSNTIMMGEIGVGSDT